MASFGKPRVFGRIVLLLLLIVALLIGGTVWFDYIGLIDAKTVLGPIYRSIGIPARTPAGISAAAPALLEEERMSKRLEALQARSDELDQREAEITKQDAEVAQKVQELDERGKALDDREKSFNATVKQYENRKVNIDQNAQYLTGMPPAKAVGILVAMDDQTVIDIFRAVEDQARAAGQSSLVALWLSMMPADRSAAIQRKMTIKPTALP
ncbi:MAG TPA: flagellar protein FlbB [Rectinemataceae bacterium]|nr:flagellar protein FlbB [Rectinemataceae bacterium]